MPAGTREGQRTWQKRSTRESLLSWLGWFVALVITAICFRFVSGQTIWMFVWDAPEQAADLVSRMFPPEWKYASRLWSALWDTINIATLGTLLAIIVSIPLAFLAARNTTPHPLLRQLALLVIVFSRSVNALIWALLLVSVIGPGILAGILAIGLRSIGFVSKLLYEAIEEINPRPIEALTSTGASQNQITSYGIVPQILPSFAGTSVYRWDINIRESTIVGLVGAGGIGLQLDSAIASLQWSRASVIFIMVLLLVVLSEWVSARVRKAIT
jgi:phosphonate transport system permease protein